MSSRKSVIKGRIYARYRDPAYAHFPVEKSLFSLQVLQTKLKVLPVRTQVRFVTQ
jgi:hypothetical protein